MFKNSIGLQEVNSPEHPAHGEFIIAERGECLLSLTKEGEILFYVRESTVDVAWDVPIRDLLYIRKKFLESLPHLGEVWCLAEDRDTLYDRRVEYFTSVGFVWDPSLGRYVI